MWVRRCLSLMLADAQEMECARWSGLHSDYCLLNCRSAAEKVGQAHATTSACDTKCIQGGSFSTVKGSSSYPCTDVQPGAAGAALEDSNLSGGGEHSDPLGMLQRAKPSIAPGSEIDGLVAAVGPQRLLIKVNMGDPRLVAFADTADATACLQRSRKPSPVATL